MTSANKIGLITSSVTALLILLVWGVFQGGRTIIRLLSSDDAPEAITVESPLPATDNQPTTTDTDSDGLNDDIESIYRTEVGNPDTDGDGTKDGDEVILLRNPIVPGPDDALVSEDVTRNVLSDATYTSDYLAKLPADASRSDVLSQERLDAYVTEKGVAFQPSAFTPEVVTTTDAGKEAIQTYLNATSTTENSNLTVVTSDQITQAFQLSYQQNQPQQLNTIVEQLTKNLTTLQAVPAPEEAKNLHTTLLQTTESLLANTKLLQNMKNDFVGGLIGAKNIEMLGTQFNEIATQIRALEAKYELE